MDERSPEQDAIARVLVDWLCRNGYPVNGPSDHLLVPIDWLRMHLEKTRENNPATDQRRVEARRWNAAVDEMCRCLDWYERRAREITGDGE